MKTMNFKGVSFRGQYAEALERLLKGEEITMKSFTNGTWEPTKQVGIFIDRLNQAKVPYVNVGESARTASITLKGESDK